MIAPPPSLNTRAPAHALGGWVDDVWGWTKDTAKDAVKGAADAVRGKNRGQAPVIVQAPAQPKKGMSDTEKLMLVGLAFLALKK